MRDGLLSLLNVRKRQGSQRKGKDEVPKNQEWIELDATTKIQSEMKWVHERANVDKLCIGSCPIDEILSNTRDVCKCALHEHKTKEWQEAH